MVVFCNSSRGRLLGVQVSHERICDPSEWEDIDLGDIEVPFFFYGDLFKTKERQEIVVYCACRTHFSRLIYHCRLYDRYKDFA